MFKLSKLLVCKTSSGKLLTCLARQQSSQHIAQHLYTNASSLYFKPFIGCLSRAHSRSTRTNTSTHSVQEAVHVNLIGTHRQVCQSFQHFRQWVTSSPWQVMSGSSDSVSDGGTWRLARVHKWQKTWSFPNPFPPIKSHINMHIWHMSRTASQTVPFRIAWWQCLTTSTESWRPNKLLRQRGSLATHHVASDKRRRQAPDPQGIGLQRLLMKVVEQASALKFSTAMSMLTWVWTQCDNGFHDFHRTTRFFYKLFR